MARTKSHHYHWTPREYFNSSRSDVLRPRRERNARAASMDVSSMWRRIIYLSDIRRDR